MPSGIAYQNKDIYHPSAYREGEREEAGAGEAGCGTCETGG